jgi:hypothetical protein
MRRIIRRTLIVVSLFLIPLVLSGLGEYTYFSFKAKRSLTASEILRYTAIVGDATFSFFLLTGTTGGLQTLDVIAEILSDQAIPQTKLDVDQTNQILPLPPQTILASCSQIAAYLTPIESDGATNPHGLTVPNSCKTGASYPTKEKFFLTLTSWKEIEDHYLEATLPQSGWTFMRDIPGASVFQKEKLNIIVVHTSYFSTGVGLLIFIPKSIETLGLQ